MVHSKSLMKIDFPSLWGCFSLLYHNPLYRASHNSLCFISFLLRVFFFLNDASLCALKNTYLFGLVGL